MKPYSDFELSQAIEAVANGASVRAASREWGIPRTTLQDRLLGTQSHSESALPQQRLSKTQENSLAQWILIQVDLGLPPTHAQVREFAGRILAANGDPQPLGKNWLAAFLRRNPAIQVQRS
jgi:hypothetical protein